MDPLTLGLLAGAAALSAGGKATSAAISSKPSGVAAERIKELERLQQADQLGLTGAERSAFLQAFQAPQQALAAQQLQQSQALTAIGQDSGRQLAAMRAQEEQAQRAQAEAGRQVELMNIEQARAQEEELRQLQLAQEIQKQQRKAAIIGGAMEAIGAGVGAAGQYGLQQQMFDVQKAALTSSPGYKNLQSASGASAPYGYIFPTMGGTK